MAIVKMNKISIIGLAEEKDEILKELMDIGLVDIEDMQEKTNEEEWVSLVSKDGNTELVAKLKEKIEKITKAIEYLLPYKPVAKGLFTSKRKVHKDQYKAVIENQKRTWELVEIIEQYNKDLLEIQNKENTLNNLIDTYKPWKGLSVPLEITATKTTKLILGVVPANTDIQALKKEINDNLPESYLELINSDKDQHYLLLIYHANNEEHLINNLKKVNFVPVKFNDTLGTIKENINKSKEEILALDLQRKQIKKEIQDMASSIGEFEILYDHLIVEKDKAEVLDKIIKTNNTFVIEGWLPAENSKGVLRIISEEFTCIVNLRSPEKDEEFPVLLDNLSSVQPFELITELYSLPKSTEIDPNIYMAPFYFMFFGLMIGDAGYGILMSIITGIILMKYQLKGMVKKLVNLLFLGGISTFIWGALFGGWFGNIADMFTGKEATIPPLWFNPLDDPMRLLIWSFIFGIIHLYAGMGINALKMIKDGKIKDAIYDVGFWYIFLTGIILLITGGITAIIGKYMAISGAILLILTQGREKKGIVSKFFSGILSLYDVTGFLSDVLSYSRLLALGLATGVIASVINTMGTLIGFNVLGIIVLIIVFIIGHLFNILINALGAYVHASRLQYVEFYGKFYEGGGKAFNPFKIKTKYTNLTNSREDI